MMTHPAVGQETQIEVRKPAQLWILRPALGNSKLLNMEYIESIACNLPFIIQYKIVGVSSWYYIHCLYVSAAHSCYNVVYMYILYYVSVAKLVHGRHFK